MSSTTKSETAGIRSVNSQITDAITQSNSLITGMAPAHSMAALYQTMSQAMGTGAQNTVSNQQHANTVGLAALTQNLQLLLSPQRKQTIIHIPPAIVPEKRRKRNKKTKNIRTKESK
ncbi:RebB family R body protein [Sneathiella glossodoripedis]|uniref:RebB family R body protein n=1 Tax=Sneathiella glossodoripedis TaxID=418853 RepID=UPI00046EEE2C|nr:RebB family R body protein [Sneathiella glossodoripedis]